MKLQPDVGHVHAVLALCCGGLATLYSMGLVVNYRAFDDSYLVLSFMGLLFGAFWCGLFAIILRGTVVSRGMASVGLLGMVFAMFTSMCAVSLH